MEWELNKAEIDWSLDFLLNANSKDEKDGFELALFDDVDVSETPDIELMSEPEPSRLHMPSGMGMGGALPPLSLPPLSLPPMKTDHLGLSPIGMSYSSFSQSLHSPSISSPSNHINSPQTPVMMAQPPGSPMAFTNGSARQVPSKRRMNAMERAMPQFQHPLPPLDKILENQHTEPPLKQMKSVPGSPNIGSGPPTPSSLQMRFNMENSPGSSLAPSPLAMSNQPSTSQIPNGNGYPASYHPNNNMGSHHMPHGQPVQIHHPGQPPQHQMQHPGIPQQMNNMQMAMNNRHTDFREQPGTSNGILTTAVPGPSTSSTYHRPRMTPPEQPFLNYPSRGTQQNVHQPIVMQQITTPQPMSPQIPQPVTQAQISSASQPTTPVHSVPQSPVQVQSLPANQPMAATITVTPSTSQMLPPQVPSHPMPQRTDKAPGPQRLEQQNAPIAQPPVPMSPRMEQPQTMAITVRTETQQMLPPRIDTQQQITQNYAQAQHLESDRKKLLERQQQSQSQPISIRGSVNWTAPTSQEQSPVTPHSQQQQPAIIESESLPQTVRIEQFPLQSSQQQAVPSSQQQAPLYPQQVPIQQGTSQSSGLPVQIKMEQPQIVQSVMASQQRVSASPQEQSKAQHLIQPGREQIPGEQKSFVQSQLSQLPEPIIVQQRPESIKLTQPFATPVSGEQEQASDGAPSRQQLRPEDIKILKQKHAEMQKRMIEQRVIQQKAAQGQPLPPGTVQGPPLGHPQRTHQPIQHAIVQQRLAQMQVPQGPNGVPRPPGQPPLPGQVLPLGQNGIAKPSQTPLSAKQEVQLSQIQVRQILTERLRHQQPSQGQAPTLQHVLSRNIPPQRILHPAPLLPGQLHPSQANLPVRSVLQAHQQQLAAAAAAKGMGPVIVNPQIAHPGLAGLVVGPQRREPTMSIQLAKLIDEKSATQHLSCKEQYRLYKRKFKYLVFENECYQEELRNLQRKLLKLTRDKNFLLDRLLAIEKLSDESDEDSDSSQKTVDERPKAKKRSRPNKPKKDSLAGLARSTSGTPSPCPSPAPTNILAQMLQPSTSGRHVAEKSPPESMLWEEKPSVKEIDSPAAETTSAESTSPEQISPPLPPETSTDQAMEEKPMKPAAKKRSEGKGRAKVTQIPAEFLMAGPSTAGLPPMEFSRSSAPSAIDEQMEIELNGYPSDQPGPTQEIPGPSRQSSMATRLNGLLPSDLGPRTTYFSKKEPTTSFDNKPV